MTLAVAGSWPDRSRLRALTVPLALTVAGLALVNLAALVTHAGGAPSRSVPLWTRRRRRALVAWTCFGVANARFLTSRPDISATTWASALGITSLGWMAPAVPILLAGGPLTATRRPLAFLAGALVLGVLTSWAATAAWNRASVQLPVSLAGQLVVVETVTGTAYSYLYRQHLPEPAVLAGSALLLAAPARRPPHHQPERRLLHDHSSPGPGADTGHSTRMSIHPEIERGETEVEPALEEAFVRLVTQGDERLHRPLPEQIVTGLLAARRSAPVSWPCWPSSRPRAVTC